MISSKIDVIEVVLGHLKTLKCANTNKTSFSDVSTFYLFPLVLAVSSAVYGFNFKDDWISLLVNFGAIFTALLLSVLVLVYDQSIKLKEKGKSKGDVLYPLKERLLNELYYNICYSIITSLSLVVFCFVESISRDKPITFEVFEFWYFGNIQVPPININLYFATPMVIFLSLNLILTIVMIVKRMHALLTAD